MLSGLFVTNINLPDTIYNGKVAVTTAGTRVQITSDVTNIKSGVVIKALSTNTGLIYVGDSTVGAANGYQLAAGESSFFEVVNRSLIYIDSAEDGDGITYIATGVYSIVPSIASVAPVGGLPAGGTAITVTGGNFIGVSSVTIDGNPCTSVVVTAATTLTAVSPAGSDGPKTVAVTGVGGTGTLASGYTYASAPTASGISPSSGTEDGGTAVTITGTNFVSTPFVIGVTIGGAACTSVVAASGTSITAVTPIGTLGAQDVVVTTASGAATLVGAYTYTPAFVDTYSAHFDGVDDVYTQDANMPVPAYGLSRQSTWSMWMKVDTGWTNYTYPWFVHSNNYCRIISGSVAWQNTGGPSGGGAAFTVDVWQHWVFVQQTDSDPKETFIYRDGIEVSNNTAATAPYMAVTPFSLGRPSYPPILGNIDEVGIWVGTCLDATQVGLIYNGGGAGKPGNLNDTSGLTVPTHWYRMGDDAGDSPTVMIDQAASGAIDMTGSNGPTIETDVP